MIRQLVNNDYAEFLALTRCKHASRDGVYIDDSTVYRLLSNDGNVTMGYFDSSTLVTAVSVRFGELHGEKTWVIAHMFTNRFSNVFSFSRPDFGLIIKSFFEIAEEQKFYNYIYAIPAKLSSVYYRQWKSNPYLPPAGRYDISKILEISANTLPEDNWAARLIGGTKPYDVVINSRKLKQEYRK